MNTKKLLTFLLAVFLLTFMSFNSKKEKDKTIAELYTYLEYRTSNTKTNTKYVFVSDVISYDDWQKNSIEIKKKFIAKALEQSEIEIWSPSIQNINLEETIEDVKIKRQTNINRIKSWEESYGRSVKIFYVNLYRL